MGIWGVHSSIQVMRNTDFIVQVRHCSSHYSLFTGCVPGRSIDVMWQGKEILVLWAWDKERLMFVCGLVICTDKQLDESDGWTNMDLFQKRNRCDRDGLLGIWWPHITCSILLWKFLRKYSGFHDFCISMFRSKCSESQRLIGKNSEMS